MQNPVVDTGKTSLVVMSKSLSTQFHKKPGDCLPRKRKQCNTEAKTRLSEKRKQLELEESNDTGCDMLMTLRSNRQVDNSQSPVPVTQSISVCGYECDDHESASDNGNSFEEFLIEMKRECGWDFLYDLQDSGDQDSSPNASSHSFNKELEQDATKQFAMALRSGRQVGGNRSSFMQPDQNTSVSGCSGNGEESRSDDNHSHFENILAEIKQECSPDLDCDVSFIASNQEFRIPVVIGEIVPRSQFNSEQHVDGYSFDSGLSATKTKQMAGQKQHNMEMRSGRLISHGQQLMWSDNVADSSQHPSLENLSSRSDFCELVMIGRHSAAGGGEYETSMPVSASDWISADNGFETLHDQLSGVKQECGAMYDENLNYRTDNDETAVTQESDNMHAGINVGDPSLETLLVRVPHTETTFPGVPDVHSAADEPLSISSQLPCNQSQLACDNSAETVDIESLSLAERSLMEPSAASFVCDQLSTSDCSSLLPHVDNPNSTSSVEEIAYDGDKDTVESSSEHGTKKLHAACCEQLHTSDDALKHLHSLTPSTKDHGDVNCISLFDETCYNKITDSTTQYVCEQLQITDDGSAGNAVFLPSHDEDCSDINLVNSTSDVCLGLISTPIQTGENSDTGDLRAYSGLCGSNVFKEKESQASENSTVEHCVEPSSVAGSKAMSDSQSREDYHVYSRQHSTLSDFEDVEPVFEITNLNTGHIQSTGNDVEHSEVCTLLLS